MVCIKYFVSLDAYGLGLPQGLYVFLFFLLYSYMYLFII